jgi:hypothetical protein
MENENKKEINWMLYVAGFIFLLSLVTFIIALNLGSIVSLQKQEIPITVIISNYSAWNISQNQSDLNLGTVNIGSAGVRAMNISNDYEFKTVFEFEIKGNITPLLIFDPVIILEPMEDREVIFRTKVIENEEFGQYSGIIFIKVKKWIN